MIDCGGNAIAFSHDGTKGALGLLNGQVVIFNADTYDIIVIKKETFQPITVYILIYLSIGNQICKGWKNFCSCCCR